MKTTSAMNHLILSSPGLTSEQFEICKELLGHKVIVGSTDSGLSTRLSDGAALTIQRMRNLGIKSRSSKPSALQEATPEFTKSIVSQCTSTLCIKP